MLPTNNNQLWFRSREDENRILKPKQAVRAGGAEEELPAKLNITDVTPGRRGDDHRITESQNSRGWKGPLWVI